MNSLDFFGIAHEQKTAMTAPFFLNINPPFLIVFYFLNFSCQRDSDDT